MAKEDERRKIIMKDFLINNQIYILGIIHGIDDLSYESKINMDYKAIYNKKALTLLFLLSPLVFITLIINISVYIICMLLQLGESKHMRRIEKFMDWVNLPLNNIVDICENFLQNVERKPTRNYNYLKGKMLVVKIFICILKITKNNIHRFEKIILRHDKEFNLEARIQHVDDIISYCINFKDELEEIINCTKEEVLILKLSGLKE